ncbi:hypothetical protein BSL78_19746 [Apostichopus japonicus]|uniref:Uncharacterized protein n=1 Tax=Stichopus japonicus TaxID=307972 RepID=A0A2G8K640_STIJA|nr:hypothetical protein BSL78_19746 [Apostichopus japonicus]
MVVQIVMVLENLRGSDFLLFLTEKLTHRTENFPRNGYIRSGLAIPWTTLRSTNTKLFARTTSKRNASARLMGTKPRKNLKPGSFPTIFVHRRPKEDHCRALRLLKRSAKQEINQLLTAKDQPPSKKLCQPLHCSPKGVSSLLDPPAEVLSPAVTPTTAVTRITQQFIPI